MGKARILNDQNQFEDWSEKKHGKLPLPAKIISKNIVEGARKQHEDVCLRGGFSPDNPVESPGHLYVEDKILIKAGMPMPDLMYLAKCRKIKLTESLDSKEAVAKHMLNAPTYVPKDEAVTPAPKTTETPAAADDGEDESLGEGNEAPPLDPRTGTITDAERTIIETDGMSIPEMRNLAKERKIAIPEKVKLKADVVKVLLESGGGGASDGQQSSSLL